LPPNRCAQASATSSSSWSGTTRLTSPCSWASWASTQMLWMGLKMKAAYLPG
jgi:hypothetical protein